MNPDKLSSIPETMLITLWAKAAESRQSYPLLKDRKATEMIEKIDYDFAKFRKAKLSQVGVCIRARLIDKEIEAFLAQYPDAVVVQLGAGIDARYERLGYPQVTHWYDLDLEEAINIRKELLPESDKNTFLAMSMFDYSWVKQVKTHGKPILIVIEGVLMYFEEEQVREFFDEICHRFEEATVVFDMLAPFAVGRAKQHDALKETIHKAEFKWSMLNTRDMEAWNNKIHFAHERYLSDHNERRYPLIFRLLYKLPYFYQRFNQRVTRME